MIFIFKTKLLNEIGELRDENWSLKLANSDLKLANKELVSELEQLKLFIEKKKEEEQKEIERLNQMDNFWNYDGTPQKGGTV